MIFVDDGSTRRHRRGDRGAPRRPASGDRPPQGQPRARHRDQLRACAPRWARRTTTTRSSRSRPTTPPTSTTCRGCSSCSTQGNDVVLASVYAPGRSDHRRRAVAAGRLEGRLECLPLRRAACARSTRSARCIASTAPARCAARPRRTATCWCASPGFAANVELLLKLYNAGATVAEVPTVNDWSRRLGSSKMNLRPTVLAYGRLMAAHLVGRIQPPPISPLGGGVEWTRIGPAHADRAYRGRRRRHPRHRARAAPGPGRRARDAARARADAGWPRRRDGLRRPPRRPLLPRDRALRRAHDRARGGARTRPTS